VKGTIMLLGTSSYTNKEYLSIYIFARMILLPGVF